MKNIYLVFIFILIIAGGAIAFLLHSPPDKTVKTNKIKVVTSFYPLYFFASAIGAEKAIVQNITPVGAEPHDYEPTPSDIAAIEKSDIVILNGGRLEAWGEDIKKNIDPAKIITAGEGLTTQTVLEEGQTITDPHVWLSPSLAKQMVRKIASSFETVDPNNKAYYETNTAKLLNDLDALNQAYQKGFTSCTRKDFVTSHAAFGYLASTYQLHQIPISGVSPDSEPSPKQLAEVTKLVKERGINVIFFEALVSPKLAQTIAREVGAKTMVLDPIEGVSDEDVKLGKNYLTIMQENLKNLEIALSCKQ